MVVCVWVGSGCVGGGGWVGGVGVGVEGVGGWGGWVGVEVGVGHF